MSYEHLFNAPVSVSSSVRPSVRQGAMTDVTNPWGVGEDLATQRAVVPALVAQIVDMPIAVIEPLERYGRVTVAKVVPSENVDPVLPWVIGPRTTRYRQAYRRYWRALMRYLSWTGFPGSRRKLESAARRLVMALGREGLTPGEIAYFRVWLLHGALGEYRLEYRPEYR